MFFTIYTFDYQLIYMTWLQVFFLNIFVQIPISTPKNILELDKM